jgi:hypothetical protein
MAKANIWFWYCQAEFLNNLKKRPHQLFADGVVSAGEIP